MERGEVLWAPTPESISKSRVGAFIGWLKRERGLDFTDYASLWRWSVDDLAAFWGAVWAFFNVGHGTPKQVLADASMPGAQWFPGMTLNFAEQALQGPDEDVVIIARSQTRGPVSMTRGQLRDAVARARVGLQKLGVGRGDRVAAYLPNMPEAVVAMLATASLGAIWASCAPEFGTQSVLDRFRQIEPTVLLAIDGYRYGRKDVDRSDAVAHLRAGLPTLKATVGVSYLNPASKVGTHDWAALLAEAPEVGFAQVPFNHPLWILFSSGTTGLPKAIVHSHGGVTVELCKSHALHSDMGPGDRYFVYCTTSWVMWNLLIGGLLVGAAIVLMDGNPNAPDALELWRMVEETGTTAFACGASLLMGHRSKGVVPGAQFRLSRLRALFCTGSPLPAEGFRWVYSNVSQSVLLQSSSGGTDICGAFVGGSPMLPVRAGEIACRCLGVMVEAYGPTGTPVIDQPGELVVSKPMPSMPVSFWHDPKNEKYRAAYFEMYPGRWRHGDWIEFTADGACQITGRSDGTLNRGGVRLGSSEFYSALSNLPQLADSLIIHLEDAQGGAGRLLLFVQVAVGQTFDAALKETIIRELRRQLSPRHTPDDIIAVPAIPYGLTGKKLEVPVKRLLQGAKRAEVLSEGAMRDPSALDAFEQWGSRGS